MAERNRKSQNDSQVRRKKNTANLTKEERKKREDMTPAQRKKYLEREGERRRAENQRETQRRGNVLKAPEVGEGDNPVVNQPAGAKGPGGTTDGKRGDMWKKVKDGVEGKKGENDARVNRKNGKRVVKGEMKPAGRVKGGQGNPFAGGMPSQGSIRDMVNNMPAIQNARAMQGGRGGGGGGGGFPSIVGAMFGGGGQTAPNIPSRAGPGWASTGEHDIQTSGGVNRSSSAGEAFARGEISREEFEASMGGGGMPSAPRSAASRGGGGYDPRNLGGGSRSAPQMRGGGGFDPRNSGGGMGRSAPSDPRNMGGWPDPLTTPGHQQTGRARPPSNGGYREIPSDLPQRGRPNPLTTPGHQQTGRARDPWGTGVSGPAYSVPYPRQGQTGRARDPWGTQVSGDSTRYRFPSGSTSPSSGYNDLRSRTSAAERSGSYPSSTRSSSPSYADDIRRKAGGSY